MNRTGKALVSAALFAAVALVYAPVRDHAFVNFDDDDYVYENVHVRRGLTADGIAWAFGTTASANYHPLTWISHMTDVELLGLDPGRHHVVNVLLHALNAVVLFLALARLTSAPGRSAVVAALFALHPLHVESVAWIAERKDLLSTLFGLLAVWGWARYAERPTLGRYAPVAACLVLGLLAKPMLVTLPFALALLDYWPLGRIAGHGTPRPGVIQVSFRRILLEKLPLLGLSAASSAITYLAQRGGQTVVPVERLGLSERLANAAVSYASYLGKTFWPADLAVYYPYPATGHPAWRVAAAVVVVGGVTAICLRLSRGRGHLPSGWLWFVGMLVPVIGLVQVGSQALADRYTYLPHVGLFVAAVWTAHAALERLGLRGRALAVPSAAILVALGTIARGQVAHWRDSEALFEHALAVTSENWMAHTNLGKARLAAGDTAAATAHFAEALRIGPGNPLTLTNLGTALAIGGRRTEAVALFRQATSTNPAYENGWYNLGIGLLEGGDIAGAIDALGRAIALDGENRRALVALASAQLLAGRFDTAGANFREVVRLDPTDARALTGLGISLAERGSPAEAIRWFEAALRIDPGNAIISENLAKAQIAARAGAAPP